MGLRCRGPHMMWQGSTEAAAGTSFPQQLPSHSQMTGSCEHMAAEATSATDTYAVDRGRSKTCGRTRHVRSCLAQVQRLVAGAPPEVEQRLREAEGGAQVLQRLCGALARRLQQRRQPAARPDDLLLQPAACMVMAVKMRVSEHLAGIGPHSRSTQYCPVCCSSGGSPPRGRQPAARPAHLLLQPAACMTGSECVIRRKTGLDWRATWHWLTACNSGGSPPRSRITSSCSPRPACMANRARFR